MNAIRALRDIGQSLWLDNINRQLIDSGTLRRYIENRSITGLTSNPTIFDEAIGSGDYDERIETAAGSAEQIFFELAIEDLQRAADLFRPIHRHTNGRDGWVSLEISPLLADNARQSFEWARILHARAERPNLFIKVPGTPAGASAIEAATFAGIPVNVTLLFNAEQYRVAAEAWMRGVERRIEANLDPAVDSVASLFVSRWDVAVHDSVPPALRNRVGIAVAKETYRAWREVLDAPRMRALVEAGARPQRLLWGSTGTKDPDESDTLYVDALAAAGTINTMPDATLDAVADHGQVDAPMSLDDRSWEDVFAGLAEAGLDREQLAIRLQREGAEKFAKSWKSLLAAIEARRSGRSEKRAAGSRR